MDVLRQQQWARLLVTRIPSPKAAKTLVTGTKMAKSFKLTNYANVTPNFYFLPLFRAKLKPCK